MSSNVVSKIIDKYLVDNGDLITNIDDLAYAMLIAHYCKVRPIRDGIEFMFNGKPMYALWQEGGSVVTHTSKWCDRKFVHWAAELKAGLLRPSIDPESRGSLWMCIAADLPDFAPREDWPYLGGRWEPYS